MPGSAQGSTQQPPKGRLVVTHSTYIPGLITLLEKLLEYSGIQTITPAVISRVKSNAPKLRLKVSVPITGGYKLIARHRKSAQEVFVITSMSQGELEGVIGSVVGGRKGKEEKEGKEEKGGKEEKEEKKGKQEEGEEKKE
ncbi:MAG: metal-binding protein [Phormidesmis sp. RL_2_1]|nr:metal-binding protein [Phormidesmis sp. RL_2_1]